MTDIEDTQGENVSTPGGKILFAEFKLFHYLQNARTPKKTLDILEHLRQETDWGTTGMVNDYPRAVQHWLKKIREPEFNPYFLGYTKSGEGNQRLYEYIEQDASKIDIDIEEACFRLMSLKILRDVMPAKFYEDSLKALEFQASDKLEKYEKKLDPKKLAVRSYLDRIVIAPRGQQLVNQSVPRDVLNVIYNAILSKRCVKMRYDGKIRILHPYAIVVREPKFYLLGVDDRVMMERAPVNDDIRQYLCNHIEGAEVKKDYFARVPDEFDATDYVNKGGLDVMLRKNIGVGSNRSFTLKLRIYTGGDNLSRDLEAFPISPTQRIENESDSEHEILTATGMRASHQLVEWILGRTDRVEVLAPEKLRTYIGNKIEAMHRRYARN